MDNKFELARMIAGRDAISFEEAMEVIENCQKEIDMATNIDEAEEAIEYWLGLEPDYLDIFLL